MYKQVTSFKSLNDTMIHYITITITNNRVLRGCSYNINIELRLTPVHVAIDNCYNFDCHYVTHLLNRIFWWCLFL